MPIVFDTTLSSEQLIHKLEEIWDQEEASYENPEKFKPVEITLKGFPTSVLVDVFRVALKRETLVNPWMTLNICMLTSGYNTLIDDMFADERIYATDIEQLLDIKLELFEEIKEFQTKLITWYLACLKSIHKVEYTYLDVTEDIPNLYRRILVTSNLVSLSQIFSKVDSIDLASLPLVKNAYPIAMEFISNTALSSDLLGKVVAKFAGKDA